jgi:hypothetical protein
LHGLIGQSTTFLFSRRKSERGEEEWDRTRGDDEGHRSKGGLKSSYRHISNRNSGHLAKPAQVA